MRACNALGEIFKYDLHDFEKAEENYERALVVTQGLDSIGTYDLINLYYNLAATNRSQNDYGTALNWCFKAVEGCVAVKDERFLARTYSLVGNIYRDRHDFDSAVMYYGKGVDVSRQPKDHEGYATLAVLYGGWGETNYRQGEFDEAAKKLRDAIVLYKKDPETDKSIYFHTVRLLGAVEIKRNDLDAAESYLKYADQIRKQENLEKGGQVSSLYRTYGDLFSAKNMKYDKALLAADGLKDYAYLALLGKAEVLSGADALECYSSAEKLMIVNRAELDTEDAKWNYVDANYRLYENILATMYDLKDRDQAQLFQFMENSKSKSLSDALREAELRKAVGKNDTLVSKLQSLRQRSLSIQHRIDANNGGTPRDELIENTREITSLEALIDEKYPSYIKTRNENNIVSFDALREMIKKIDAVFVEYFWGDENVYALVVDDSVKLNLVGKTSDLENLVDQYLLFFTTKGNQYSTDAVGDYSKVSYELYSLLLTSFDNKRLIIVPDGPLMQVPFETLVTKPGGLSYKDLSYLLNDHIISYDFSASHLLATPQPPKNKPSLLAFGFTGGANERSPDASKVVDCRQ
ncbi:MAG: tetratricopeptide repeat protein [Bacteroidota bacterium]